MFKNGFRKGCMFWEKLGLIGTCSLSDWLNKEELYINYKEKLMDEEGNMV